MHNKLVGVGLGIVLVVWMVMRDQKQKSGTSEAVRDEARMIISQMEGYENDKTYMESVVTRAHDQAFSLAYKDARHGGRFRASEPASFNEDNYLSALFLHARRIVQDDIDRLPKRDAVKYEDVKRRLEELKKRLKVKD